MTAFEIVPVPLKISTGTLEVVDVVLAMVELAVAKLVNVLA